MIVAESVTPKAVLSAWVQQSRSGGGRHPQGRSEAEEVRAAQLDVVQSGGYGWNHATAPFLCSNVTGAR